MSVLFIFGQFIALIVSRCCTDGGDAWSPTLPLHCMAGLPCSWVADCLSRLSVCDSSGESSQRPWNSASHSLQCWDWPLGHNLPCWYLPCAGL